MIRRILPVIALMLLMVGGVSGTSSTTGGHATVFFQFGNGEIMSYTVSFSGSGISAINATIDACQNLSIYLSYTTGTYGAFVNQIGWEKNDFSTGMYWHLMVWKNGSSGWVPSGVGASKMYLKNRDVISWSFMMDSSSWVPYDRPHVAPGNPGAWLTPRGNFNNTGVSYGNVSGQDIAWEFRGQSSWGFSSSPVVANGRIYIADSSALYALTMAGSEMWNTTLGAAGYYGMASPVVFGDYVIIYTSNHTVRAFYQENGTVAWSTRIVGDAPSPPVLGYYYHTPMLFYATFVMNSTGELYAINAYNGSILWSRELMGSNYFGDPAILNDSVVVPIGGIENQSYEWNAPFGVQCIGFNGSYLWNYTSEYSVRTSVAVANNHIYFVTTGTGKSGNLVALNFNGTLAWRLGTGSSTAPVAVHGNTIFVGNDTGYVMAIRDDGNSAVKLWSLKLNGAVKAGLVYASEKIVAVTDTAPSEVYCLYANGTLAWNHTVGTYDIASPAVVGSYLLVASNSGVLYAFTNNETRPEIGEISASTAMVGQPVVVSVSASRVYTAILYYRNISDGQWHAVWMYYSSGKYVAVIPAQTSAGTVDYYVVLTDENGNSDTSSTTQAVVSSAVPEFSPAIFLVSVIAALIVLRLRNR